MEVYISEKCLKCGMCVRSYPDCFEMRERANVKDINQNQMMIALKDAADFCPVNAIIIKED